jgi:hypothetical protein
LGEDPLHEFYGYSNLFVISLDSDGQYRWHSFYGRYGQRQGQCIATDSDGFIIVGGLAGESWDGPNGQSPLNSFFESGELYVLKLGSAPQ